VVRAGWKEAAAPELVAVDHSGHDTIRLRLGMRYCGRCLVFRPYIMQGGSSPLVPHCRFFTAGSPG
jgi:hypothetical protein